MGLGVVGVVLALACACCFGVQASWSREGDAEVASEARDRRGRARDDHQKRSAPSPKTAPRRDGERRREREQANEPDTSPDFPLFSRFTEELLVTGWLRAREGKKECVDRRLFLRRRKGKKASPRPGSARAEGGKRKEESGPPQQPPLLHPPLNHTSPSAGTLQALTPQISLAYSPIVRSVENLPLPAVDRIDLRAHPASSR